MIFSYNWLQDYIKEKLPKPEKLAELLAEHFFGVEEVKKIGDDFVLDIDVKPNRAGDCFSHFGIAREIAAIVNCKLQIEDWKLKEDKNLKAKNFVKVEVKDKIACPRYTARVITDVKVGPSPKWMQDRLRVCGLQSISNIVDITNYVMLETGQPLHAFDFEKLKSYKLKPKKLIIRFARKGEKIITLDDKKFDLDENILVIADERNPIAIAGIKGGKGPGIDNGTKLVVLESANFNSKVIRKGSKTLNLKTDASWRFEHGIDPNLTEIAINRASQLIQELAGGKIAQGLVDFYPSKIKPKKIYLEIDKVERLLGLKIPKKEIIKVLKSLEFKVRSLQPKILEVEIPTLRLDVSNPEDLIEEIGRIYGYEKIVSILPKALIIPPERNLEIFWQELAKDTLKENGFSEVYNYSFINKEMQDNFGYQDKELVEVENCISSQYQYLSPCLIPRLLENTQKNLRYFDDIRIFELGKTFKEQTRLRTRLRQDKEAESREQRVIENRNLTGLIATKAPKVAKSVDDSFYELKGVLDFLLEKMGVSGVWYDEYQPTPEQSKISIWNIGKCAEIKIDNQEIGFLGEISQKVLEKLEVKAKIMAFDIDFEKLEQLASEEHEFKPISPYPAAIRDVAVLVPANVKVVEALNTIERAGGELVRDVDLFDIYEGDELPGGKKNLAFHIIYQAEDRTLTAKEIDNAHKKIVKALEENLEWEVRK